uniref:Pre-mRNA-processing factor 6 n=1 Tax=Aegilops tauschii TaxID=37682 RepID=M8C4I5_AEGTA
MKRFESFVPVPDTLLQKARQEQGHVTALDLKSLSGLTVVDPKGYLTDLNIMKITSNAEISDIKKARLLLRSVTQTNPKHPPGWIAAARLEEVAGKLQSARQLIQRGSPRMKMFGSRHAARLETYDQARKVLNKAREKLDKEPAIWITFTAAKLEEANENTQSVSKTIERGVESLQREGLDIDREAWLKEAEAAERAGSMLTCQAIVKSTIGVGVDDEDRKQTWVADAEECTKRGSIETARAIYAHALSVFVTKKSEKWLAGEVPAARAVLQEAYAAIPISEEIWLAAFKLEFENNEPERARMLLTKARKLRRLLEEGLKLFASFFELWLMLGQMEDRMGRGAKAKEVYENALKHCPGCIPLWLSLASLEERINGLSKSRAFLTLARKKNPATPELWLAAIRAELRHGNNKEADSLLAKALQECPTSGILWAAAIEMVPRAQRKSKSSDAIKRCDHDPHVIAAVAKLFWHDRKVDKARSWFNRAASLAPDIGDFRALYYKSELQHGNADTQRDVLKRCIAAEPKHGERWQATSKAVENSHQPTDAILRRVVLALDYANGSLRPFLKQEHTRFKDLPECIHIFYQGREGVSKLDNARPESSGKLPDEVSLEIGRSRNMLNNKRAKLEDKSPISRRIGATTERELWQVF